MEVIGKKIFEIIDAIEINWKAVGGTTGALSLVAILNAAGNNDVASQEQIADLKAKVENIKNVAPNQVLKLESTLIQYASEHGADFEVTDKKSENKFGKKFALGENIGVRVFYKADRSANGFAIMLRDPKNNSRDAIVTDGVVNLNSDAVPASGGKMDGVIDQMVYRVSGKVVAVYTYHEKKGPDGAPMITVDGKRLNSNGDWAEFNIGDADKSFVTASEYMLASLQTGVNAINKDWSNLYAQAGKSAEDKN